MRYQYVKHVCIDVFGRRSLSFPYHAFVLSFLFLVSGCAKHTDYFTAYENADFESSFELLKIKLSKNNDPVAQNLLAIHYELGLGTMHDYQKALSLFKKAALSGLPVAQFNLGRLIESGRSSESSLADAYGWYCASWDNGYEKSLPYIKNLEGQMFAMEAMDARERVADLLAFSEANQ